MRTFMILTVLFAFVAMPAQAADLRTDADQSIACDTCGCKAAAKADDKPCGCKGECKGDCKKADDKAACGSEKDCGCKGKAEGDTLPCGCKKGDCKCKKDAPAPEAGK